MIQSHEGTVLEFYMYRFHFGSLTVKDWDVYAMLPKTKKHLTQKCEGYKTTSTQFRQHGRKAYIRGYMHGFCHKTNMFTDDGRPNTFVEIMDVDWVLLRNISSWRRLYEDRVIDNEDSVPDPRKP
jgi:hypothetical protein